MGGATQPILISALQHYAYCPRQFALIHIEQVWSENYFTAHGNLLHERVDSGKPETRSGVRYERSVSVRSEQYWLTGKLDLLEVEGKNPLRLLPVEYKRGKPKVENWDKIQLCAQALCLEVMRGVTIDQGALWYWQVRRRETVSIDQALREETVDCIENAHRILSSGKTPAPTDQKKRCKACSLITLCEPDAFRSDHSKSYVEGLFTV